MHNPPKRPREASWKTWCSMAGAWNLPPISLTEELVIKVGASFKAGHYKSPQNYFSRALQEHRQMTKQRPSPFVQSLIKNVIRSITRGAGHTAFKDSFEVELLNRAYDLNALRREPTHWAEDRSRDATLICCWWLLRGIAAAASTKHVWHQQTRDELTTFITLPVQKNDTTGACVSRGHSCLCKTATHLKALCPHHAMLRHLATLRRWFPQQIDLPVGMPLIPGPDGNTISQQRIVQLFRETIQRTGTTMDRPGPTGEPLPRFSQHSCRKYLEHSTTVEPTSAADTVATEPIPPPPQWTPNPSSCSSSTERTTTQGQRQEEGEIFPTVAIGTTRSGDRSDSATRDATHPTAAPITHTYPAHFTH